MAPLAAAGHEGKPCSLLKQESPELPGWICQLLASLIPVATWELWASPCQGCPAGHCACPFPPFAWAGAQGPVLLPVALALPPGRKSWPHAKCDCCWTIGPMPKVLMSPTFFSPGKISLEIFKGNLSTGFCFHKSSPLLLQRCEKRVELFLVLTYEYLLGYI